MEFVLLPNRRVALLSHGQCAGLTIGLAILEPAVRLEERRVCVGEGAWEAGQARQLVVSKGRNLVFARELSVAKP